MVIQKVMEVIGGEKTPLSEFRLCGMRTLPNMTLDMSGSPHLTIDYL